MNAQRLHRILIDHSGTSTETSQVPTDVPWHPDEGVTPALIESLVTSLTPLQRQHCAAGHQPTAPNSSEDLMQKRMERFGTVDSSILASGHNTHKSHETTAPVMSPDEEKARLMAREAKFGTGAPEALTDERFKARLAKFGVTEAPPPPPTNTDARMKERAAKFGIA